MTCAALFCLAALLPAPAPAGDAPARTPFTVGIELPSQAPMPKPVETALKDLGIGYVGFYLSNSPPWEQPEAKVADEMLAVCRRLGVAFTLDCHHRDPRASSICSAAGLGQAFRGVLIDELTHIRLLYPEFRPADGDEMLADPKGFTNLADASAAAEAGLTRLYRRLTAAGAPCVVSTEVWPSLLHMAARVGMTPCPKICKEFYSPVSMAVGLGAALQYGRDLWVDVDMWYFDLIPGHPAEEVRTNLLFAYWMGADLAYLEGCGYNLFPGGAQGFPFSLLAPLDAQRYQLTPHGEMLKEFCTRYLPAHPRPWTFRDIRPEAAIIRFDDTDVGQKSWGADRLFGTTALKPDRDTAAWLGLWNVLTHGRTGADGIAWFKPSVPHTAANPRHHQDLTPSWATDAASQAHGFFTPLNGVVVFDDQVGYERLKGIPLLLLAGKSVSAGTLAAIRRRVEEGALCVAWGPLARSSGLAEWTSGTQERRLGRGRVVATDDFQSPAAVRHYRRFLGRADEIRYRFGERTLTLRRLTDNTVETRVTPALASGR